MRKILRFLWRKIRHPLQRFRGDVEIAQRWPFAAVLVLYVIWRIAGGRLPLFMLRSMMLLLLGSYLWTRWMIRSVECIYEADRREITRGEEVKLSLRFENEGFVPIPNMMARSTVPGKEGDWTVISSVPPLRSRVLTLREPLMEHGRYRLGPVEIAVSDPFGWFRGIRRLYGNRYLTVYPRIFPIAGQNLPLRRPFGTLRTRIRSFADPSNLADIRPMVAGDNPRHIHWPTSARMGEPYVREFELTASGEVNVVLDLSADPDTYPTLAVRELAFDLAAGVAATSLRNDLAVGLTAHGGREDHSLRAAKGARHLRSFLKSLAHSRADSEIPLEIILRRAGYALGSGSTLLVITGRITPSLTSLLTSLMQSGLGVALFLARERSSDGFDGVPGFGRSLSGPKGTPFPIWTVTPDAGGLDLDASRPASDPRLMSRAAAAGSIGVGGDTDG